MKKVKRIVCIIMTVLIIVTAPITSYMEANATEAVVTAGVLDYLLGLFGVSVGMGNQSDFWSQANMDYISDGIANGSVVSMGSYGDVDFSSSQSVYSWINTMAAVDGFLVGASSGNLGLGEDVAQTIKNNCVKMDMISYHNTGTTATGAMNEYLSQFVGDYNGSSEALAEDIRDCFTVIQGGGNFNDDNDDDEQKAERRKKFWRTFSAIMSGCMIGNSIALPLSALKEASDSQYHEYDAAFEDICFDGTYQTNANGEYVYRCAGHMDGYTHMWTFEGISNDKAVAYFLNDKSVAFISLNGPVYLRQTDVSNGTSNICPRFGFSANFPLYTTQAAAKAALAADDFSGAENLNDAYRNFKNNTSSAASSLGSLLGLMSRIDNLSKLADIVPGALSTADTNTGTPEALTSVNDYISGATPSPSPSPSPSPDPDPEPGTGTGKDYTGILGKILTAINNTLTALNNLPAKMVNAFAAKFMTAEGLEKLVNGLPDLFALAMKGVLIEIFPNSVAVGNVIIGLENMIVQALPDAMAARIIEIFPDAEAVGNAILGFPDAVAEAVKGIKIEVPEIKVPEITVPEPKVYLDLKPIVEVPQPQVDVTLNPDYNITVQNDFTGLGDIIVAAVSAALSDLFVPDADATKAKLGDMREYFKFKDDIIGAFDDLKTMIFGITPSPILKIPIGAVTSKYNYGFGSYIVIDISWYAPYKQFGDKIILAICWALFIWRLYIKLPGIISGTEGSIVATDKSYNRYISKKDD